MWGGEESIISGAHRHTTHSHKDSWDPQFSPKWLSENILSVTIFIGYFYVAYLHANYHFAMIANENMLPDPMTIIKVFDINKI